MPYSDLYDYCQTQPIYVRRNSIKAKILEITGKDKLPIAVSGLDVSLVRGLFFSIESDCRWVKQFGSDVIVIARDIQHSRGKGNLCWDRFITVKEMMHLFDTEEEVCDTGQKFDELISQFTMNFDGQNVHMTSEIKCFWRALGVLCPNKDRVELKQRFEAGNMMKYDIALQLRIPEQYVGYLLHDNYAHFIEFALS